VLLSDHANEPYVAGTPPPWTPVPEIARAVPDCGIASAERHGSRVVATVACNRPDAARGRRVELSPLAGSGVAPSAESRPAPIDSPSPATKALADAALDARAGVQSVTLAASAKEGLLAVRLTGEDALGHDDTAPVSPDENALGVAVVADSTRSGVVTGGATPLEQALIALEADLALRPLAVLPDESSELDAFGLVVLDDPRAPRGSSNEEASRSRCSARALRPSKSEPRSSPSRSVRRVGNESPRFPARRSHRSASSAPKRRAFRISRSRAACCSTRAGSATLASFRNFPTARPSSSSENWAVERRSR